MTKLIHELTRGECRFPTTPDHARTHYFCAEPVEADGVVYCAEHAKLCYDRRTPEARRISSARTAIARAAREKKNSWGPSYNISKDKLSAGATVADHLT